MAFCQGTASGPRVLLVAYGNDSRRDDGVAFHILDRLSDRLGVHVHDADADGGCQRQSAVEALRLHQLAPELAEVIARYSHVIFIDAHVDGTGWDSVQWRSVEPAYEPGMVGHDLRPAAVLALCASIYGETPVAMTLSVLGSDFDFGETLSPATSRLADEAVSQLFVRLEDLGLR